MGSNLTLRAGVLSFVIFALFIAAWHIATRQTGAVANMDPEYAKLMGLTATQGKSAMPGPLDVGAKLWEHIRRPFYDNGPNDKGVGIQLAYSIARVAAGYLLAVLFALPIGMMVGRVPTARMLLDPFLQVMRPIPVTAWLPLSMILFGLGAKSAFALVCLGAFYPILLNTIFGVRSVDPKLFEAASMLGCKGNAQFFKVVLPAATPSIFTGLRLGLGLAWFVIVVGEMTGVPEGLGAVIMDGRTLSRTDLVIAGMIVIGVAGFVTDRLIVLLNNRLLRWSPQHHV